MLIVIDGKVCLDPRSKEMEYLSSGLRHTCASLRKGRTRHGICVFIEIVSNDCPVTKKILHMLFRRWSGFSGYDVFPVPDDTTFNRRPELVLDQVKRAAADRYFDSREYGTLWDVSTQYGRLRYGLLHFLIGEVLRAAYAWKLHTWKTALRDCGMPSCATKAVMFGAVHGNGAFPAGIERQLEALCLDELQECRREVERIIGW